MTERKAAADGGAARAAAEAMIDAANGVLRLDPSWVARDWLPAGRRLGLPESAYDLGERGSICERWLGSTTRADNRVGPDDEGLSYLRDDDGRRLLLRDAVAAAPVAVMGREYAATHPGGLGRLAKIFDYGARIPYHVHPQQQYAALVGCKPKDEAYYFPPGVDLGAHPESFFGVHPWIARDRRADVLLPYLQDWDSDRIEQSHLRERLNDIASDVSRLVYALEGNGPIDEEESLAARMQKFVDAEEAEATPVKGPRARKGGAQEGQAVSDRLKALRELQDGN